MDEPLKLRVEPIEKDNKIWVSGWGNTKADIMIVTSHPMREDLKYGYILSETDPDDYSPRDELMAALRIAGIKQEQCWFTCMVKFGIGSKAKPTSEDIKTCAEELDLEIATIKPKLIISLGAEVFKRIQHKSVSQSDYVGEIIDSPYGPQLVQMHPVQVLRVDPKQRPEFILNFELAKRYVEGTLKYQDYEYLVVEDVDTAKMVVQHYIDTAQFSVGYDLEWVGEFKKDLTIYTAQFSCEPHKSIILKIVQDDGTENLELLYTLKPLLEHPKADRLGWNIRADDRVLTDRGFNLPDETLGFDGMKAVAFFDSRYKKGLETGIKKFTNYRPYYNRFNVRLKELKIPIELMSTMLHHDPDVFYEYCGGDAVAHREACLNMRSEMQSKVPHKARRYYYDTYLPLSNYLRDMEFFGAPIDVPKMEEITNKYVSAYNRLKDQLLDYTYPYDFDSERYNAKIDELREGGLTKKAVEKYMKEESGLFPDFNPASSNHKKVFFFEKLKLKPAYFTYKNKQRPRSWYEKRPPQIQKQCNPSTNSKSISSILFDLQAEYEKDTTNKELAKKIDIVRTYLDLARVGVFANKFLSKKGTEYSEAAQDTEVDDIDAEDNAEPEEPLKQSYWAALCPDNRIHASFYECLDNFRSSSRVNIQNPASKVLAHMPGIFERLGESPPDNIRNIFWAGDPDWLLADIDVAGADLAIVAFLSGDPKFIHDIRSGSFHTKKMREYFKDDTLSKKDASKYVIGKAITFRTTYTSELLSAAQAIQAEIYAESGIYVEMDMIVYALNTWNRYEVYMDYRRQCLQEVENDQRITNARGLVYRFEHTDDFGIRAGWLNQSLAFPVASELALFMWDVSMTIRKQLIKDKLWMRYVAPTNSIHDAGLFSLHKDLMKDNYFPELAKQVFTKDVKIATGDNLGMEIEISDRWKGKHSVFSRETVWDFENSEWIWGS